jgi:DNA-binding IclR family transcriptional regulator
LTKLTPWTIGSVVELLDELAGIRRTGQVYSRQEVEAGLCGTSVVLPGRSWRERIALCATVPRDRGDDESLRATRSALLRAAAELR